MPSTARCRTAPTRRSRPATWTSTISASSAYELIPDSCGHGRRRGGLGLKRSFLVLKDGVNFACYSDRMRLAPYGLFGGTDGQRARIEVQRDGTDHSPQEQGPHGPEGRRRPDALDGRRRRLWPPRGPRAGPRRRATSATASSPPRRRVGSMAPADEIGARLLATCGAPLGMLKVQAMTDRGRSPAGPTARLGGLR